MNYQRLEPRSKITKSIVIFMHGYGADGSDLLSIGNVLSNQFPDTLFLAPDAPTKCQLSPFGFQWFPIPSMDGTSETAAMIELDRIASATNQWIDNVILEEGVLDSNVFLFGFSQGTMLSLYMGPQRKNTMGGIIGFSGKVVNFDIFKNKVNTRPPVLLIHGDEDQVVSPSCLIEGHRELTSLKFDVKKFMAVGVGHGISEDGLSQASKFLLNHSSPGNF